MTRRKLVRVRKPRPEPRLSARKIENLIGAGKQVRLRAHAPYSHFLVGAAIIDDRGRVHAGCNVENASYGLTICAERNAVASAVAQGATRIHAVAVVTGSTPPSPPCGACLQVLSEFADRDVPVYLVAATGTAIKLLTLGDLLPRGFRLKT